MQLDTLSVLFGIILGMLVNHTFNVLQAWATRRPVTINLDREVK